MCAQTTASSPRLGYLLRTYPVLSETFVTGEIRAVARLSGQPPVLAALYRPGDGQGGEGAGQAYIRYWRDIDKGCLGELARAHARVLTRAPAQALRGIFAGNADGLGFKDRAKATVLAAYFLDHGVGHIHSHFGWEQADTLACINRLTGLPYSLTLHAADIFVAPHQLPRRATGAAFVATISEYNKHLLVERFGLPSDTIHVVHCGVDLKTLDPTPLPATAMSRVVSVGRMVPKKGFDILLRALAMLRAEGVAFHADLVGEGPLRPDLEDQAAGLGLGEIVHFHGALPPERVHALLRAGHVFALACRAAPDGDMDGIPVALMEAMALSRAVVSTRLSGIPELVAEGCGLLAAPGSAEAMAGQLYPVLMDRELAARLAVAGRRRVERDFTLDGQAGRILELAAGQPGGSC